MKKYFLLIILFPFIGSTQTYTVTQQSAYGQDPDYTRTTYTVKQTSPAPAKTTNYVGDALKDAQNNIIQTQQSNAQRELERKNAQEIINNQNRIEEQRIQEEKRQIAEKERIEEDKDPNSILNKFKNVNLKKENEDLKKKLLEMEVQLSKLKEDQKTQIMNNKE